jgi:hypothetical protein
LPQGRGEGYEEKGGEKRGDFHGYF